ncbi:MAG TPA: SRPBCC domain-containing protein [Thermoanaerobaculia bacterium]|nr:SRPBCC domain-containing protein [Thermoanaerobaculia bacterium]
MPKQKDLKRIVRSRMHKTGESYTAARLHIVRKKEGDFAERAGMSEAAIQRATGRSWAEWVKLLDDAGAISKPHREIAQYVSSIGTPDWWSQTVTVGYERIRGLRDRGQRRGGGYEASKSKTFAVPVKKLFSAFRKLANFDVRSTTPNKRMRIAWDDGTTVEVMFLSKGDRKSAVAVTHQKLPDKAEAAKMKAWWGERLDALAEVLQ